MMFSLHPGAPSSLPSGTDPWRLVAGSAEVYLLSPARRRLLLLVEVGDIVVGTDDDSGLTLSLVSESGAALERAVGADCESWWVRIGAPDFATLDRRFADEAEGDDRRVAARLATGQQMTARQDDVSAALAQAAADMGLANDAVVHKETDFDDIAVLARLSGLRASHMVLPPGWWQDDRGPLILRSLTGGMVCYARWHGRNYLDGAGTPVTGEIGQSFDSLAWRLYPPLTDNVTSFTGMAKKVLKDLRVEIGPIVVAGLGTALLGLLVPLATGWLFDDIVPAGAAGLLVSVGIALMAAAIVTAILSVVRARAISRITGRGGPVMLAGISDHILRLPTRFFKTLSAGDFNQRIEGLDEMRGLVTNILLSAGLTVIFSLIYLALLFAYDPRLALAGLVLTLFYAAAVVVIRALQMKPLRTAAAQSGRLAGLTFEILEGLPKLRTAASEGRALRRWQTTYEAELLAAAKGEHVASHFSAFSDGWHVVTMMSLFAVAALLAASNLSAGVFIAFLAAFGSFQASFTTFCDAMMAIYSAAPLAERAAPIITAEPESSIGCADPGRLRGAIQVSGLTFSYNDSMAPLIDGLSFEIKPGEHLAIVGGSGSGKSTILRLLLGFERPSTGSLTYDGQELSSLDPSRIRSQIGVVLQASQLFAGSIQDNIRGASNASLEQCIAAAQRTGLAADLALMPMGLHTPITEGAATLSGGQRQRILVARAIAGDPAILFFDEATSALDNVTQAIVADTLDNLGATRLTIAHRLSTVRNADRICVLERGKFVESGTFEALMLANGPFAALARRQLVEA